MGIIINVGVVRELGPVLAATMIAGRVGCAMAAELGTMTVTEQVDALIVLGAPPLHFLVVPRVLACVLLIPLLTVLADITGILGGGFISTVVYQIEGHFYWTRAREAVSLWDISTGLLKSVFFGAAIAPSAVIAASIAGPVRKASAGRPPRRWASFIAILGFDFVLAFFLDSLSHTIWPEQVSKVL